MVHARLFPGSEASGKLVAEVRQDSQRVARDAGKELIIIDGSPGIGCPVIASITGIDLAVCISEPSVAGLHDLDRVYTLLEHFGIPAIAVINRFDINTELADEIEESCQKKGVEVVARIPYDNSVVEAMVRGEPPTSNPESKACRAITDCWEDIQQKLTEP
jgi:MinD superfamily P-loop ATPase